MTDVTIAAAAAVAVAVAALRQIAAQAQARAVRRLAPVVVLLEPTLVPAVMVMSIMAVVQFTLPCPVSMTLAAAVVAAPVPDPAAAAALRDTNVTPIAPELHPR